MPVKRFKYLLSNYLSYSLTVNEKTEFFELICSGDFDNEIEADFKSSFYEEDLQQEVTIE